MKIKIEYTVKNHHLPSIISPNNRLINKTIYLMTNTFFVSQQNSYHNQISPQYTFHTNINLVKQRLNKKFTNFRHVLGILDRIVPGCTLQINEPQLQRSKHQCATHQRLSTSTASGWSSEQTGSTKSSALQRLYTSTKITWKVVFTLSSIILH
jgi:hypothetical protein